MAKIKHKPLTNIQYNKVFNHNDLTDLYLLTGVRLAEAKRLIDNYNGEDYIDIKTKYSGNSTNRIHLSKESQKRLKKLSYLKGMSIKTYQRKIKSISEELGIKFSSHNLRATFAVRLIMIGVDLVTISTLMNHSDIKITSQYIRLDENKLRTAVESLADYETLEGMTLNEAMKEIVRLRKKLLRQENK